MYNNQLYRDPMINQQLGQNVPLSTSINLQDLQRQQYLSSPYQGQNVLLNQDIYFFLKIIQGSNYFPQQQYSSIQNRYQPQMPSPARNELNTPQTVKEIHHVERPLEVITIEEIEGPWRQKCATLERQILELQIQLRKGGLPQIETIEVIDDTKVKELEKRAQEIRENMKKSDVEVEDLNEQIRQLQIELEESGTSKITYLTNEVDTWKKKFTSLNKEYSSVLEELTMVQAQLENLQKQQQSQPQTTIVRSSQKKGSKFIQQ